MFKTGKLSLETEKCTGSPLWSVGVTGILWVEHAMELHVICTNEINTGAAFSIYYS